MKQFLVLTIVVIMSTGCASIVNDSMQPIKVQTQTSSGELFVGAECVAENDYGTVKFTSGDTPSVHRSAKDLSITCRAPAKEDATARAISRANAGLAGNILLGGGIGAIIDHNRGTAYTYPTWIQMMFGKAGVFDRKVEKDGAPVDGTPVLVAAP